MGRRRNDFFFQSRKKKQKRFMPNGAFGGVVCQLKVLHPLFQKFGFMPAVPDKELRHKHKAHAMASIYSVPRLSR